MTQGCGGRRGTPQPGPHFPACVGSPAPHILTPQPGPEAAEKLRRGGAEGGAGTAECKGTVAEDPTGPLTGPGGSREQTQGHWGLPGA